MFVYMHIKTVTIITYLMLTCLPATVEGQLLSTVAPQPAHDHGQRAQEHIVGGRSQPGARREADGPRKSAVDGFWASFFIHPLRFCQLLGPTHHGSACNLAANKVEKPEDAIGHGPGAYGRRGGRSHPP